MQPLDALSFVETKLKSSYIALNLLYFNITI